MNPRSWTAAGEQEWTPEVAGSGDRRGSLGRARASEAERGGRERGGGGTWLASRGGTEFPEEPGEAGASTSHTAAAPSSFPKHLAISPGKEGARDSVQPRDMTPRGSHETQERKIPPRHGSGRREQDRGSSAGLAPRRTGMRGHSCRKTRPPWTQAAGEAGGTAPADQSTG